VGGCLVLSSDTNRKTLFITGASGCVGQYLLDLLIKDNRYDAHLLVRNANKLKPEIRACERFTIIQATLADFDLYKDALNEADILIHLATSWDGNNMAYTVNVDQSLRLLSSVNRERCKKILYFSTSSILDSNNQPLAFAKQEGTDYVRSKYLCHEKLSELDVYDRITTLFPSLIMAASKDKPVSHVSSGIPQVARWVSIMRFFKADGSFHFIHAHDIALITQYLLENECDTREIVLGNQVITFNECIHQFSEFFGKKVFWQFELTPTIAQYIIKLFNIKMSPWDYYYIEQRHFTYKPIFNPASFGLKTPFSTLSGILAEH
jgi:nucleoside-diphosphate-sugar epimerase